MKSWRYIFLLLSLLTVLAVMDGVEAQTSTNFDVDASANDADITKSGASYPPSGDDGTAFDTSLTSLTPEKSTGFTSRSTVITWDTSSLPEDAIVTGADLIINVTAVTDTDERQLVVDWHSGVPPITVADYDETGDGTGGSFDLDDLSVAVNTLSLNTADHTISTTDMTAVRLTISGGEPSGSNLVTIESFDNAGTDEPRLSITYTTPLEQTSPTLDDFAPITAYENVRESGDMLVVAPYNITLGSGGLPSELAQSEYQFIFRDGPEYLQVVNPVSTSENGLLGYEEGFAAFYFSATQVDDLGITFNSPGTYTIELDAVNGSQNTTSTSINYRPGQVSDLQADLTILAQVLEAAWDLDIINNSRLTATGQDYFESVIPFLEQMVPGFVNVLAERADPTQATHATTGSDAAADFWAGTSADTAFTSIGDQWGMSSLDVRTGITLIVAIVVAIIMLVRDAPAWSTLMVGGVIVALAPSVGMAHMALALVMGFVGFFCGVFAWWFARA